jgi:hypothetical protein
VRKTVSKSAPDNGFRQSLKKGFFKNTGKQVFFANSCFDDNFLRILFFSMQHLKKRRQNNSCLFSAKANNHS